MLDDSPPPSPLASLTGNVAAAGLLAPSNLAHADFDDNYEEAEMIFSQVGRE